MEDFYPPLLNFTIELNLFTRALKEPQNVDLTCYSTLIKSCLRFPLQQAEAGVLVRQELCTSPASEVCRKAVEMRFAAFVTLYSKMAQ